RDIGDKSLRIVLTDSATRSDLAFPDSRDARSKKLNCPRTRASVNCLASVKQKPGSVNALYWRMRRCTEPAPEDHEPRHFPPLVSQCTPSSCCAQNPSACVVICAKPCNTICPIS